MNPPRLRRLSKAATGPTSLGLLGLALFLSTTVCRAADLPVPSGSFTFEDKPYTGTTTLTEAAITNRSLYLSGEYTWPPVVFRPLVLDYRRFTVVVKLRPEISSRGATLLVGGTATRWFVVDADKTGKVELSFNNHEFRHPVEGLSITNKQWTTIALSLDLQSRRAVLYANGNRADEIVLPENFNLAGINEVKWKDSEKELTFTDCGTAGTLRGFVAGLLTFDSILSPDQVRLLLPNR